MGKKSEWDLDDVKEYVASAHGNLTLAAKFMNEDRADRSKVSRQNLQTWIDDGASSEPVADAVDNFELLRRNRLLTKNNLRMGRELRNLNDSILNKADTLKSIAQAVQTVDPSWPQPFIPKSNGGKNITVEIVFSDLQIGKLMDHYDSEIAIRRVQEWLEVTQARLQSYTLQGYNIEKIIFAVLGDVIESDKKHDNSGRGCDIGTAEQMRLAIDILFSQAIKTFCMYAPLDVVMVTGNHDHDGHGLSMYMPGREHLSWPLYNAVKMLSAEAKIDANFYIPEGSHHIHNVYGANVLYEHGVGVATSEAAMKAHVAKRINQTKEYIHLFRMG